LSLENQILNTKELLRKAFERFVPSVAHLISPQAGFAVSVAIFATWVLSKVKKAKTLKEAISDEQLILVDLSAKIDEKKRRIKALEEELTKAKDELTRKIIEHAIEVEKNTLETLIEEYELHQLRIIALNKLRDLGDRKLYEKVWKLLKDIEEGRRFEDRQLEVMKVLEDKWRKRQLKTSVILQILKYG